MTIEFPTDMQRRVYEALLDKGDVSIEALFRAAYPQAGDVRRIGQSYFAITNRDRQQYLGPLFSRMNVRLDGEGLRIVPGERKQTYRLSNTKG